MLVLESEPIVEDSIRWPMNHQPPRCSSIPERSEPKLLTDLPGILLLEILCRLPCYKLVFQSKCVSKRWCTLISDPYFIGRFLCHLRSSHMEAPPIIRTLINRKGVELSSSPLTSNLLAPVFRKLIRSHGLKCEPIVKATYNDLVLCCEDGMDFYYICNPFTEEWVPLPPSPRSYTWRQREAPAAIICDRNYYDYTKEGTGHNTIMLNADYRCKVIRILPFADETDPDESSKFTVEIFSSETGEWKESVVASPVPVDLTASYISYAYDGMLYWWDSSIHGYVGMDPFMINSNANGDHYELRSVGFDVDRLGRYGTPDCLGVCGGGLRICYYRRANDTLYIWDWKEEEDCDQIGADNTELCWKPWKQTGVYSLGLSLPTRRSRGCPLASDPSNDDMLYLDVNGEICVCNIRTRDLTKLVGKDDVDVDGIFFPLVLPWWPTPVPRLQKPSWLAKLTKKLRIATNFVVSNCLD